jgi:hypothetical protein
VTGARGALHCHAGWIAVILLAGIVSFQVGRMLAEERAVTGGELSLPLDDSFIYLQYARGIAEGHPFVYTTGNAPTTGATSLLYPLLLVPPHVLRLGEDAAIGWSLALGAAGYLLSALLMLRLGRLLGGPVGAGLSVALFLLVPHLLWGYMSGMEIALYGTVLLATLHAYLRERREGRFGATRWWLFALAGSRPEGAILAGVFGLAMFLDRRRASRSPGGPRLLAPSTLLPFAAAALPFLVTLALSGSIEPTSAQAKSILADPNPVSRAQLLRETPRIWARIGLLYLSLLPTDQNEILPGFVIAGGLGLLLFAALTFAPRRRSWDDGRILLALLPAGIVVNSIPYFWFVHLYRYQQGIYPLVLLAFACGYGRLAAALDGRVPRAASVALGAAVAAAPLLLWAPGLLSDQRRIPRFYALNCENILHQQVRTGRWIDANLPRDAVVALNDAGAIAYYGNRSTVDLVGLTTAGLARAYRSGIGCLYEALRRLPPDRLPDYFAIYPEWFPYLDRSAVLGPPVFSARLSLNTICGGVEKVVYPADWAGAGAADRPAVPAPELDGLRLVDALDHAWLRDEARHEWRPEPLLRDVLRAYPAIDRNGRPVTDGGRIVHGGERFRARVIPGRDLVLVMRTDAWYPARLRVSVDGRSAGVWSYARSESAWVEPRFRVPGSLLARDRPEFRIAREGYDPRAFASPGAGGSPGYSAGDRARTQDYAPFRYWLYQ